MKKIFVISAGRSDYDRYYPIIDTLNKNKNIKLFIFISNAHKQKKFGKTQKYIDKKFKILNSKNISKYQKDNPQTVLRNFSEDLLNLAKKIKLNKPDIIIVMGDRFEMLLGSISAIPFNIPVIHFYGGAVTQGSTDELVRHAITKMSHYHFPVLKQYSKRVEQMGEEKKRIKTIGLHEIKYFKSKNYKTGKNIKKILRNIKKPFLLVTFHPVTLELNKLNKQIRSLLKAIKKTEMDAIFTYPNADVGHEKIISFLKKNLKNHKKYSLIKNCGSYEYFNLLKNCFAVVGNSSSGIVEAASFKIPCINIGTRQSGKFFPGNVVNSKYGWKDIYKSILKVKQKSFQNKIKNLKNPYESNYSLKKLCFIIGNINKSDKTLRKKFVDFA